MNFIYGLLLTGVGFLIIYKTEDLLSFFGPIGFFDRYLGTEGGSRLGYKFIGLLVMFAGIMMMTGLWGSFMRWLLSPLINVSKKEI